MLSKTPKPTKYGLWNIVKGSAKTIFVIEAVCFAASYGVYYRMNTNREFRSYINENYPFVLDYYYKIGELVGNNNIRQIDADIWKQEKKTD